MFNEKKYVIKCIVSGVMYVVGFILFTIFLAKVRNIDSQAWLYSIISSFGVFLFCTSRTISK